MISTTFLNGNFQKTAITISWIHIWIDIKIPWIFPDFNHSLTKFKIHWFFPDLTEPCYLHFFSPSLIRCCSALVDFSDVVFIASDLVAPIPSLVRTVCTTGMPKYNAPAKQRRKVFRYRNHVFSSENEHTCSFGPKHLKHRKLTH